MSAKTSIRLISYSEEIVNGEPIYIFSNCLPVKASKYEPAGRSFHNAALQLLGMCKGKNAENDFQSGASEKESSYMPSSESYKTKGKKKGQDHYALLGLAYLRYLATEAQIKKSYHHAALKHHPDKQAAILLREETEAAKQAKKEEIENNFKAIKEAYEVLIDPVRRRIYDSTDKFDDEIPTDCAPQNFFKVFGPAFLRNGRWSVSQPVPTLGTDCTPIKDVDSFYNFWYNFKSWREFPHAESCDHKGWMEWQNAKISQKARKKESARVRNLVDNAYKRDPRILRRKEEEKAEKLRKIEAKYLAKKLQEEAAARIAEEQKRQKEEEEKRAAETALQQKKIREKEKKQLRKERTRLRTLSAPFLSHRLLDITEDDVENLCMTLEVEQMRTLCDKIETNVGLDPAKLLKEAIGYYNKSEEQKRNKKASENGSAKANGSVSLSNYEKKEIPWGKEEIDLLRKGMLKYPKGTSRRWEVISEYLGTGRSVEEILKATKTIILQKPDSAKAFDSFLEKRKPGPSIASQPTTREEIEGVSTTNGLVSNGKIGTLKEPTSLASDHTKAGDVTSAEQGVFFNLEQDLWSQVQERALVQALKTFPKEVSQRWERVAAAVSGKTVNQCKKKFVQLKESLRSKKSTA